MDMENTMQDVQDDMMLRARHAPRLAGGVALLLPMLAGALFLSGCVETRSDTPLAGPPLHARMSDEDVRRADATVQLSLEEALSGDTRRWRNASSGGEGSVVPVRTWRNAAGVYCRAYRETITIGSSTETYRGVACRDHDGIWRAPS